MGKLNDQTFHVVERVRARAPLEIYCRPPGGCNPQLRTTATDSYSWVDEGVTVGSCRINRLLFPDDLVLLASCQRSLKHALGRFSATCYRTGMKITKNTEVLCLSTNPRQSVCCKWAAIAAGGEVQVRRGGIYDWHRVEQGDWYTDCQSQCTVLRELYRSVFTKWEFSNTANLSVFKSVVVRSLPMVMNLE